MFAPIDLNESAKNSLRDAIKADVMAILNEGDVEISEGESKKLLTPEEAKKLFDKLASDEKINDKGVASKTGEIAVVKITTDDDVGTTVKTIIPTVGKDLKLQSNDEAKNEVKAAGEYIIKNVGRPEVWKVDAKTFGKKYKAVEGKKEDEFDIYVPKGNPMNFVFVPDEYYDEFGDGEHIDIHNKWDWDAHLVKGSYYLLQDTKDKDDIYGIEKKAFEDTYNDVKKGALKECEEVVNESNPCELGGGKPASNGGDTVKVPKTSKAKAVKGGSPAETAGDEEAFQDGGDSAAAEEDEKDGKKTEKKAGTKEEKKSEKTDGSEEEPETIDDIIKEIKDKDEELAKRLKDALKLDRKELKDEIKELKKDAKDADAAEGADATEEAPAEDVVDEPEGGMEEITVDDVSVDEAESVGKYSVGSFLVDAKKIKDEDQKKPVEVAYEKDGKEYQKKVVDYRWREDGKGNGFLLAGDGKFVRLDRLAKYFATDEYVLERDDQIEFSEEGDDPKFRITGFDFEKNAFTAVKK